MHRRKMWLFIWLTVLWAVVVGLALLMLWIERDGSLPAFRFSYLTALLPGPILAGFAIFFRVTESPRLR